MNPWLFASIAAGILYAMRGRAPVLTATTQEQAQDVPTVAVTPTAQATSGVPGFQAVATWRREVNPLFPYQSDQRWTWPDGLPSTVGLVDAGDSFTLTVAPFTRYDAPPGYTFILPQSAFVKSKGKIDPLKGLRMFPAAIATAAQSGIADVLTAASQLPKAAALAAEAASVVAGPAANFALSQGWLQPGQVKQVSSTIGGFWAKGLKIAQGLSK
jgi:hypothetical protein